MPGIGNGAGGLAAILAAKRAAAAEGNGHSGNGATPNTSRPGSSMGALSVHLPVEHHI
jgi:hypothetical protein